tara:strand:+ start:88 stop:321 length:234 start_codon:yes stop_codon:yes gene_type:complete
MTPKKVLDDFLKKKINKKNFKNLSKLNLIFDGFIDSLDIVTISHILKKKFKIDIEINEKNIKVFNSYKKLLEKIDEK